MNEPVAADARRVATRVDGCRSVARRSGGVLNSVATYLPGERIVGIRFRDGRLEVHVVMTGDTTVATLEHEVGDALAEWRSIPLDLVVDDIEIAAVDTSPLPVGPSGTGHPGPTPAMNS